MKPNSLLSQLFIVAAGLLLLGGLGAYWPSWVAARSANSAAAPEAIVADAITYQGYLTDENDVPLNGTFQMRFIIFNDPVAGATLWDSGNLNIPVNDGLFSAQLLINTDIFNGEELWVSQIVDGETLTPRQEILPAPMAHTLRPGAVIKGTASAIPNNYTLDVTMNNDALAFNRGAIAGVSTTGNAIYGLAENGRAIYGQTQDGYAVYGFDGGSQANRGYGGYFYSTNGIGVYGYSNAERSHPNIYAPGVYGQSNRGVGVYGRGDTSNSHTFYNQGGYFVGGKGLYALGTDSSGEDGYGAQIVSLNYRGMFAQSNGGFFDAYFGSGSGISASNVIDRGGALLTLVVNLGESAIEPGDLVAMVGVSESPENGQPMLAVAKVDATNLNAVIGVAKEGMVSSSGTFEDGSEYVDFSPAAGVIEPNGYLVIVTNGLAPAVNISSLTLFADGAIGDKVTLSASEGMTLNRGVVDGIVIGKLAGLVNEETNTVPMFIDID